MSDNAAALTKQGIARHQAGDLPGAAGFFIQAVQAEPSYEMGWLWLSSCMSTPGEKRYCLDQALAANPASAPAAKGLAQLGNVAAVRPAALGGDDIAAPPHDLMVGIVPPVMSGLTDRQLLDQEMAAYVAQGWRITSQSDTTFQLTQPKQWSVVGLILFVGVPAIGACLWWPLAGVAVIGLLLVLIDYLVKTEETKFITIQDVREALTDPTRSQDATWVARIVPNAGGGYKCSQCSTTVTQTTKVCPKCKKSLIVSAAVYAGSKQ